jgi:hypothetical protein
MKKTRNTNGLHGYSKRVYYEEEKVDSTGKTSSIVRFYSCPSEPAYIKVYQEGLSILSKIKFASIALILDLAFLADYPAGEEAEKGGTIDLTPRVRKELLARHDLSASRFQATLSELIAVDFMVRVDRGSYQINPCVLARGQWKYVSRACAGYLEDKTKAITLKRREV